MPRRRPILAAPFFLAIHCPALAAPQPTGQIIAALEARISAQDARIAELEAKLEGLVRAADKPASPPVIASAPSPVIPAKPAAGDQLIKLRGRAQIDALVVNDGAGGPTGTQVRRLYLGAEGKIPGGFRYQADVDFAGNNVALQDVLIAYRASPSTELVLGYFKPQITSDDMTSDVSTLFLERSAYAGIFAPGRRIGAAVHYAGRNWGLRAGLFREREDSRLDIGRKEGWVASARLHADLLPGDDALHVAVSGYRVEPSATDGTLSFSQRPETNRAPAVIDTGAFAVDHGTFAGGELGFGHGPFTLQAEGGVLGFEGPAGDPRFWGWSAQAAWRLSGEERRYDPASGLFGRVTPTNPVDGGGWGAWEVGARMTKVDLSSGLISGGRLSSYGVVLNWIPAPRLRLGANLIRAVSRRGLAAETTQDLLTFRGAVDW